MGYVTLIIRLCCLKMIDRITTSILFLFLVDLFFHISSKDFSRHCVYWQQSLVCFTGIVSFNTPIMVCGLRWPESDPDIGTPGGCEKRQYAGKSAYFIVTCTCPVQGVELFSEGQAGDDLAGAKALLWDYLDS